MTTWARAQPPATNRAIGDYERLARQWQVRGARMPRAVIRTERGDISIELFGADAPLVVEAFMRLASTGYYRNTYFHRVVPNFVAQDGDARGDGGGGPGFTLRESWTRRRHERGSLGLATSGPDTGGSQYYVCHSSQPHLDGGYTVFGRVVDGFDVLDRIVQGDRMIRIDLE
jgi:cyclophilin family peptidyl-prolyl cis-trans isomerase